MDIICIRMKGTEELVEMIKCKARKDLLQKGGGDRGNFLQL